MLSRLFFTNRNVSSLEAFSTGYKVAQVQRTLQDCLVRYHRAMEKESNHVSGDVLFQLSRSVVQEKTRLERILEQLPYCSQDLQEHVLDAKNYLKPPFFQTVNSHATQLKEAEETLKAADSVIKTIANQTTPPLTNSEQDNENKVPKCSV